ncbi:hypothetical protein ASPCAL03335 [Aspergillus calidoustus]|uniref:Uncharacterized protein n=1 Tax=Aspergillus calidoustus TaxID=454130 RepID=A0A0U5FS54_ASPCI|nr:hypothetical protein ASPCAL03335 [Aspergillus calidoustus]
MSMQLDIYDFGGDSHSMLISPNIGSACSDMSSLAYFMHHYVVVIHKSPCGGHLTFLPDLYREKGAEPCLSHAVQSVAYLSLFNLHGAPTLWYQARRQYSLALAALAAAIDTPESAAGDEVFASSLLLSMFVDLSNERTSDANEHIPGMHALMQLRSPGGKYGRGLLAWAATQMVQTISTHQYQYALLPPLLKEIQRPDSVSQAVKLLGLLSHFCQSVQDIKKALPWQLDNTPTDARTPFNDLLCEISWKLKHVFYEIDNWHACLPFHWKRQLQSMRIGNALGAQRGGLGLSGQDAWTTCFLALITSAHLAFYIQCLDSSKLLHSPSGAGPTSLSLYNIEGRIREAIRAICSAVQCSLGSLDENGVFEPSWEAKGGIGHNLLSPMELVARCRFASPDQALLCTQALQILRR